jgi:hypothetical protein
MNGRIERFFGTLKEKLNAFDPLQPKHSKACSTNSASGMTPCVHISIWTVRRRRKLGTVLIRGQRRLKRSYFSKRGKEG